LEKLSDSSVEAGYLSFDERLRPRSKWPEPGPAIPGVLTDGGEEICHKPLQEIAHPTAILANAGTAQYRMTLWAD
jgi:hypothetical protein